MASCRHQLIDLTAPRGVGYSPVVDYLTAFLEVLDRTLDVPWLPTEYRRVDGRRVRDHPQLVLLNINSVLVESTLGPPHHVPRRSRVNGQDRGTQNHSQWMRAVGVSRVVQEDGELKSWGSVDSVQLEVLELTESSTSGCPIPRMFCLKAVNDSGRPNKTKVWSMRWDPRS